LQQALQRGPGVVVSVSAAATMAQYRSLGFVVYRQGVLGTHAASYEGAAPAQVNTRHGAGPVQRQRAFTG